MSRENTKRQVCPICLEHCGARPSKEYCRKLIAALKKLGGSRQ